MAEEAKNRGATPRTKRTGGSSGAEKEFFLSLDSPVDGEREEKGGDGTRRIPDPLRDRSLE